MSSCVHGKLAVASSMRPSGDSPSLPDPARSDAAAPLQREEPPVECQRQDPHRLQGERERGAPGEGGAPRVRL